MLTVTDVVRQTAFNIIAYYLYRLSWSVELLVVEPLQLCFFFLSVYEALLVCNLDTVSLHVTIAVVVCLLDMIPLGNM